MEIIKLENNTGKLIATSLDIAKATVKEHARALRDIREELAEDKFAVGHYLEDQNNEITEVLDTRRTYWDNILFRDFVNKLVKMFAE